MSSEEANKALMRRWYDEMWANCNFDLIPELAGPSYTRHDVRGTRVVTAEEYRDELLAVAADWKVSDFKYFLMAEGDFVTAIGTWKINDAMQWDWVQTFRIGAGKLVETWLPAMATEGRWSSDEIPESVR
ncbi:MAG: nuclear transport factor 2 family protein [Deltaproteobacteria bacterium]|nr:nuclear transport factor 2 family protein [Deltaproteobacteria bacterium]